jgi:hypothetical protein
MQSILNIVNDYLFDQDHVFTTLPLIEWADYRWGCIWMTDRYEMLPTAL